MSKRRLFVLIMAVCVVICMTALMTACGSRDKSGGETAAASEETTDDSAGESAQEQIEETAEQEEPSEDSETAERPVIPDRGPAWATGYGIESYDAERDLVIAWVQFHTNNGTVRLEYAIWRSVQTHEEMWPQVAASNGYTFMPGPPLLSE